MLTWYLQIGASPAVPFLAFGASRLRYSIGSQKASSFGFTLDGAAVESDPLLLGAVSLTEGTLGIVSYSIDGFPAVPFFSGRLHEIPRRGSGTAESVEYELLDGWHDFERNVFQQQWNVLGDVMGTATPAAAYRSECILGMALDGSAMDSGAVITEIVNWAIGCGAVCQLGVIGVSAPVPMDEVTDLPCSECIKKMLRWTPDAIAWFDYSVSPPKFNVTRRADCTAKNLSFEASYIVPDAYGNPVAVESLDIKALPDLVPPCVIIHFLEENNIDGTPSVNDIVDVYPPDSPATAYGAMVMSCRLAGTQSATQKVPVQVQPILAVPGGDDDTDSCNWWRNHVTGLHPFQAGRLNLDDDSTGGYVVGADGTTTQPNDAGAAVDYTLGDYPSELVRGELADWMNVKHARLCFYTRFTYSYPDAADEESLAAVKLFGGSTDGTAATDAGQQGVPATVSVRGTNATSKTYDQLSSYTGPEPVPAGLAQAIYTSVATLHYTGSYTMVAQEVSPWSLGQVLNLQGGRAEWEAMNALLQEIEHDLDAGKTTLKFGPPGHLTLQDLMEQLRANRTRTTSSHIKERQSGNPNAPLVNNTTTGVLGDGSVSPATRDYPWEGAQIDQPGNSADDLLPTYDVVLGYGQSSIVADSLPNPDPIMRAEISVGNDGSGWTSSPDSCADCTNVFSMVTGDTDYTKDRLWIGALSGTGDDASGGSMLLSIAAAGPMLQLSPNLNPSDDAGDDPHIHINLATQTIEIQDAGGNVITAAISSGNPSLTLNGNGGLALLETYANGTGDFTGHLKLSDGANLNLNADASGATIQDDGAQYLLTLMANSVSIAPTPAGATGSAFSSSMSASEFNISSQDGTNGITMDVNNGFLFNQGSNSLALGMSGLSITGSGGGSITANIVGGKSISWIPVTVAGTTYYVLGYT